MNKYRLVLFLVTFSLLASHDRAQADSSLDFRDDFAGKSLNPHWRISGEDRDRWTLLEGDHLFVITGKEGTNKFKYIAPVPKDYTMEVSFFIEKGGGYHRIVFGIERDNENRIDIIANSGSGGLNFVKIAKGEVSDSGFLRQDYTRVKLKIIKRGMEFNGYYDSGSGGWNDMGKQFFIGFQGTPTFSAITDGGADTGVHVEYFQITSESIE